MSRWEQLPDTNKASWGIVLFLTVKFHFQGFRVGDEPTHL